MVRTPFGLNVIDSTYTFTWEDNTWDWKLVKRNVVIDRYPDATVALDLSSAWDVAFQDWTPKTKHYFASRDIYPNAVKIDSTQDWDIHLESWISATKSETYYNDQSLTDHILSYQWDKTKKTWYKTFKGKYEYVDTVRTSTFYYRFIGDTTWVGASKNTSIYNAAGALVLSFSYMWDKTTKSWKNNRKGEINYDSSGNRLSSVAYLWDEESEKYRKISKIYTSIEGGIKYSIHQQWDTLTMNWVNTLRTYTKTYTSDPTSVSYIDIWDHNAQVWFRTRATSKYLPDANNNIRTIVRRRTLQDTVWQNDGLYVRQRDDMGVLIGSDSYKWDDERMDWKGRSRQQYFRSMFVTTRSGRTVTAPSLSVFPNPVRDRLFLSSEAFEGEQAVILGMNGASITRKVYHNSIPVHDLPAGVYTLLLKNQKHSIHTTWIKQ